MIQVALAAALLFVMSPSSQTNPDAGLLGPGRGSAPVAGEGCGELLRNADGTYENAYALRGGPFLTRPYGSFAECFQGSGAVCSVTLDLSANIQTDPDGPTLDVFVWDDADGEPGNVLCVETGLYPGEIALWPEVSHHSFPLSSQCCVEGAWWAGKYDDWGTEPTIFFWYLGADLDGPGGCPLVNVIPGFGYPSGWQDVSVIFLVPTQAMGIGAELVPCDPVPTEETSWGTIKSLYYARDRGSD